MCWLRPVLSSTVSGTASSSATDEEAAAAADSRVRNNATATAGLAAASPPITGVLVAGRYETAFGRGSILIGHGDGRSGSADVTGK